MQVLKFGGTSVANAQNIEKIVGIVLEALGRDRTMIVCSAISGCTDALIRIGEKAAARDASYIDCIAALQKRHDEIIGTILTGSNQSAVAAECSSLFDSLRGIAQGVYLVGELTSSSLSAIESFGELLSTRIIAARFVMEGVAVKWLDSRELITVDEGGAVDTAKTYASVSAAVKANSLVSLFVAPGFIASDENGRAATLGRGGSDYTASLFAVGTAARRLEIWTDVPGMMTANPKVVPAARTISNISYRAALELSHFGAKVIYPPTIHPVVSEGIPIFVKNTFDPSAPGTLIEGNPPRTGAEDMIGISNSDDIALISLEGNGMVGVPGFSSRLFAALSNSGINIILITQASSVHTMCIAISGDDAQEARKAADECFAYEISLGKLNPLKVETGFSIVCLVGDDVISRSGATGRMLAALGRRGIPVRATAQGSSERNISAIVASADVSNAIRSIHKEFFERTSEHTVSLYIAGYGTVGKALVQMIKENAPAIASRTGKRLSICGISNSRRFVIDQGGLDLSDVPALLRNGNDAAGGAFFETMRSRVQEDSIFVDCTANAEICNRYSSLLLSGYSIVACNKILFSASYSQYQAAKQAALASGKSLRYETTVGAALPILCTLQRCVASGDEVLEIEAVLSGTLNYLFSNYQGHGFAALVEQAHALGYTEPDPAIDLSGKDVLRKIVILSREAGVKIEESDVEMEPVPCEEEIERRYCAARKEGKVLRYVASLYDGKARIGLKAVGPESPLFTLCGTDNAVVIRTTDYPSPMMIRGAGAGSRQTAGGILKDICDI